jgi:hypothetical protein
MRCEPLAVPPGTVMVAVKPPEAVEKAVDGVAAAASNVIERVWLGANPLAPLTVTDWPAATDDGLTVAGDEVGAPPPGRVVGVPGRVVAVPGRVVGVPGKVVGVPGKVVGGGSVVWPDPGSLPSS